jgi:purine-binding chemotaxis protein CheW
MLLLSAAGQRVALRLQHVVETLRPLPLTAVTGLPAAIVGVAVVRGIATPVVDLRALLGGDTGVPAQRWVSLRIADRQVALAVDRVTGVGDVDDAALDAWPGLLGAEQGRAALGVADGELMTALDSARLVPDEAWQQLDALAAAR